MEYLGDMDQVSKDAAQLISELKDADNILSDVNHFLCLWAIEGK
jgi:hypothetical protein